MGTPQIIVIALFAVSGTASLLSHGAEIRISFWQWALAAGINATLLVWGGFFG